MKRNYRQVGLTLVELLVVFAILVVLVGLIYAVLEPVRDRGRQANCLSNLRQIGQAVAMYRADYGGSDPPGATTCEQLGLPHRTWISASAYFGSRKILQCPSFYLPGAPPEMYRLYRENGWSEYMWIYSCNPNPEPPVPPLSEVVRRRGDETPIVADPFHGFIRTDAETPGLVIVLRLGGQVERRMVVNPSWEW